MNEYPDRPIGDSSANETSADRASDRLTVVSFDDDFDFDTAFPSETELTPGARHSSLEQTADAPGPNPSTTATPSAEPPAAEAVVRSEPASRASDEPTPSVSVADLLENNVRLDWHEAVAIALRLCRTMAQDPAASVQRSAVEPWNVEITGTGSVQILPGGTSSDPIVQQVGRVLRALLRDAIAPAELRLIAAQASFDVPVFSTVEELARALRRFEREEESSAIRTAFQKGVEAKFSYTPADVVPRNPALTHAVVREEVFSELPVYPLMDGRPHWRLLAAAFAGVSMLLIALNVLRSHGPLAGQTQLAAASTSVPAAIPMPQAARSGRLAPIRAAAATPTTPPLPRRRPNSTISRSPQEPTAMRPELVDSALERMPAPARNEPPRGSLSSDERRAVVLIDEGRLDEAAIAFDSIVLRNPSYRLNSDVATPAALSLFKRSKQTILPSLARNQFESARQAFDSGDYARAIAASDRASLLLNDPDVSPPAELRAAVASLRASAIAARTTQEERIYSNADAEVLPPRPLGRQLPALQPAGLNPQTIGRLEVLVDRRGLVEAVKLHTPTNAYHDRMIVSAAKAWHYRPALRNGKPVRFNLLLMINLPEPE